MSESQLLNYIKVAYPAQALDLALKAIETALDTPIGRVHDWRNYIPTLAWALWDKLPLSTKLLLYMGAEPAAESEEWE